MKINITSQQYNPLLKRKEITFEIRHEETKGTPPRLEVRKALSEVLKANVELVYVRKVQTKTGTMQAKGEANIYDSIEQAKFVESEHIIERNVPSEKKPKEEKAEKAEEKPKPEKVEKVEKAKKTKEAKAETEKKEK